MLVLDDLVHGRRGKAPRETHRIDVDERNASKAAHERDELIQIPRASPGDGRAQQDEDETEDVLLPLDVGVVFAGAGEEFVFRNADDGIQLKRGRQKDGEGVEKLHSVDEFVILREVKDDDGFCGGAVGGI